MSCLVPILVRAPNLVRTAEDRAVCHAIAGGVGGITSRTRADGIEEVARFLNYAELLW